jgi:hypothetical protein
MPWTCRKTDYWWMNEYRFTSQVPNSQNNEFHYFHICLTTVIEIYVALEREMEEKNVNALFEVRGPRWHSG